MITSLIGSHGTGKTTVFERVKQEKKGNPDYLFFSEGVRDKVPSWGYSNPYKIIGEVGIGIFEISNIAGWSIIDSKQNQEIITERRVLTDRSAVDNFAYFLTLKKGLITSVDGSNFVYEYKLGDGLVENLLQRMAQYYASLVDQFVYFPCGTFPLKGDPMRPLDRKYQEELDQSIKEALGVLKVPKDKVHFLKSSSIEDRVKEVTDLLDNQN